ncbi:MAG: hypothetical protein WBD06_04755 [Acidobacteriaceae bacterium]
MGSATLPSRNRAGLFGPARHDMGDPPSLPERKVLRAFRIPPLALLMTVLALAVGELACGTGLYFVTMMMIAMLSIGVTYNLLGGLSSFSGLMFAGFALRTIVISQFAKVALWEAADKNLEAPALTITVYAVFYLSVVSGVWIFGKQRVRLPKPAEPETESSATLLYATSLILGVAVTFIFELTHRGYGGQDQYGSETSAGVALAPLLLMALVLAVDMRIRRSHGKHSFGLLAFVPFLVAVLAGFIDTVRTAMIVPVVVYVATCYVRGYRFRFRHYASLAVAIVLFTEFIGPLAIFSRDLTRDQSLWNRAYYTFDAARNYDRQEIAEATAASFQEGDPREQYFSRPGTYMISRVSLIRADSALIDACAHGFHYGLAQVDEVISGNIPTFLDKNKSRAHENNYLAYVAGMAGNLESQPVYSVVADSYGAFGWPGVFLAAFVGFPAVFVLCESMFDIRRPWGTVAFGMIAFMFGELNLDRFVIVLIRYPFYIVAFSYLVVWIVSIIPTRRDAGRASFAGAFPGQ